MGSGERGGVARLTNRWKRHATLMRARIADSLFSSMLFYVSSPRICVASGTIIVDGMEKGGIWNE